MKRTLTFLFGLLFVFSLGMFGYSKLDALRSREAQQAAQELAKPDEEVQEVLFGDDPNIVSLQNIDLEALREVNPDVLGWIVIPDTQLEYPLMKGLDNQYYLEHAWDKTYNVGGSIFLEKSNSEDLSDYHTLIYGHRMRDGSMFGSLRDYASVEYWQEHPYVYIRDDNGVHRYEIFSAYEANTGSRTYQVGFAGEESIQAFLEHCVSSSVIDTGIVPEKEEKILTLSTCTSVGHKNVRWVVQARFEGTV